MVDRATNKVYFKDMRATTPWEKELVEEGQVVDGATYKVYFKGMKATTPWENELVTVPRKTAAYPRTIQHIEIMAI